TPIDIARDAAEQLITTGKVVHVWIGVEGEDVDSDTATRLSINGGAMVRKVRAGSPADNAGLANRDIITHVDGHEISSMGGLIVGVARFPSGLAQPVICHHPRVRHPWVGAGWRAAAAQDPAEAGQRPGQPSGE